MKCLIAVSLMGLSFQSFADDNDKRIDYKYCQGAFNVPDQFQGAKKDFPFKMKDDGKVQAHKDANYTYDEKTKTETIKYKLAEDQGFGAGNEMSVVIKRNDKGVPTQVIYNSEFKGMKTKTGLGSKSPWGTGMGMYGPGIGIGYPGVGGGFGGINMGPSKNSMVYDVKIKSGKCFPYRSINLFEQGNNTHTTFSGDIEMCKDILKMLKEEGTEGSEQNRLKACYDKYQKQAEGILQSHKKRNDDLYNPKEEGEVGSPWGTGGYFGELGGFPGPNNGGGGYGHPGGFAGSIDQIVENQMFTPAEKVKILSQYCSFPFGGVQGMLKDEDLFKKDPDAGGEGSGGESKDGSTTK